MSRRVRIGAFIALLILWPIGVTVAQVWFPDSSGINLPSAVASLIFFAACAVALRSRTISGTLLGLSIPAVTNLLDEEWKTRLLGYGLLGLVWGVTWEALHSFKPQEPELPSA
jgi:hypothetical protein